MDFMYLLTFVMGIACTVIPHVLFIDPYLVKLQKAAERQKTYLATARFSKVEKQRSQEAALRRKQISDTLKEVDENNRGKAKSASLEARISQAGLSMTRQKYFIISGVTGTVAGLVLFIGSLNPVIALGGLVIGGLGLPSLWLNHMRNKRIKKFINEFPGALDIIIRGVKAGLPLNDCLKVIAQETSEPVCSEFRQVIEAQHVGLTITEAIDKLPQRMPTPEAEFFAIVIGIQQKAGGNLSEALGNLSRVLRERRKMREKIKAMSSEAKASAGIIGSLPLIVGLLVYMTTPKYMSLLWTTNSGRITVLICLCVMGTGIFIMKKMISFDI